VGEVLLVESKDGSGSSYNKIGATDLNVKLVPVGLMGEKSHLLWSYSFYYFLLSVSIFMREWAMQSWLWPLRDILNCQVANQMAMSSTLVYILVIQPHSSLEVLLKARVKTLLMSLGWLTLNAVRLPESSLELNDMSSFWLHGDISQPSQWI
jgi:hypothetical protein